MDRRNYQALISAAEAFRDHWSHECAPSARSTADAVERGGASTRCAARPAGSSLSSRARSRLAGHVAVLLAIHRYGAASFDFAESRTATVDFTVWPRVDVDFASPPDNPRVSTTFEFTVRVAVNVSLASALDIGKRKFVSIDVDRSRARRGSHERESFSAGQPFLPVSSLHIATRPVCSRGCRTNRRCMSLRRLWERPPLRSRCQPVCSRGCRTSRRCTSPKRLRERPPLRSRCQPVYSRGCRTSRRCTWLKRLWERPPLRSRCQPVCSRGCRTSRR